MATDFEVEEWDADFIDKLVKAEELAITTSATQTQHRHHQPHPPRPYDDNISHSPPRELSQRLHDTPAVHSHALLGLASSSLAAVSLGPDCSRERKVDGSKDKKEEQLKFISSKIDDKELESCHAKSSSMHYGVGVPNDNRIPPEYQKGRSSDEMLSFRLNMSSKAVGVQTDDACDSDYSKIRNDDSFVAYHHQKKLLDIWEENSENKLALKLFETCGADFEVLSGHLNVNLPSNSAMESSTPKSDMPSQEYLRSAYSAYSADAVKISHLFLILTKISNGMLTLEDLLEALMDCCCLRNGLVVHSTLRVLHAVLKNVSKIRKKLIERENFMFTGPFSEQILADMHYQESYEHGCLLSPFAKNIADQLDSQGATWFKAKRNSINSSPPKVNWLSLFELMNQITVQNVDEHIRLEAVSIMNTILINCNAYSDREKFASKEVFQTVSMLLRKAVGLCLRKQAVNLFFKLLNCPKVTTSFCYGSMEDKDGGARAEADEKTNSSVQEFREIVDGLVDCLSCRGNCTKRLKLQRSTITVIAYIASLGKAGVGIILNHRLPQRSSILVSILESLISDVGLETVDSAQSFEIFRERTLLIREALILLNRLVSHPQFSTTVLQTLTSGRDVTSLTIDVAKRLCHRVNFSWQDDSITRQIRESEITELARLFERKIFTFLGDDLS